MAYVGTPTYSGSNVFTLASILQGESSSSQGWAAIGNVMANRAAANYGGYGSDIMSQALAANQFQGQSTPSAGALSAAQSILDGSNPNVAGNAMFYAAPGSTAGWAINALNSGNGITIGGNTFFSDTNGTTPSGVGAASLPGAAGNILGGTTPTGQTLPQFAQLFGGNTSPSATANPNVNFNSAGGAPVTVTDISSAGQIAGKSVQSGLTAAGSDVVKAGAAADTTATGITNSFFGAVSDFFIRGGLGLMALVLIGVALWMFGPEIKEQMA